eukprot:gene4520-6385_t
MVDEENIKVVVRIRPLQAHEKKEGDVQCVKAISEGKEVQVKVGPLDAQVYRCNQCFANDVSQAEFFQESGITVLIDAAINGYRTCAFAFGQTGAGKTFTMIGGSTKNVNPHKDRQSGMVGRTLDYLFAKMNELNIQYMIKLSCVEIYHENVFDLFAEEKERNALQIREHATEGFFLEGCKLIDCDNEEVACSSLDVAMRNRQTGTHDLNSRSSRSHCITTINIEIPVKASSNNTDDEIGSGKDYLIKGRISLVDLAGSERLKSTNSTGKILQEAGFINKSLYVLGKVIAGLVRTNGDLNHKDVPFRDSKLTKLLISSLGGKSMTLLIACVSEAKSSQAETLRTLKFSMSCARIRNKPVKFLDPQEKLILDLREEIKRLKNENKKLRSTMLTAPTSGDKQSYFANIINEDKFHHNRPSSASPDIRKSNHHKKLLTKNNMKINKKSTKSNIDLKKYKPLSPIKKKSIQPQKSNSLPNIINKQQNESTKSILFSNQNNHNNNYDINDDNDNNSLNGNDQMSPSKLKKMSMIQLEDVVARRGLGPRIFKNSTKELKPLRSQSKIQQKRKSENDVMTTESSKPKHKSPYL